MKSVQVPAGSPQIIAAYAVHDEDVRVQHSKVAHILIIVLVPAGATLDWFVYPQRLEEFVLVRFVVAAITGALLALHWLSWTRRQIPWFAMIAPLLTNAAMSYMILRSEGVISPYYAGINLVLAGISVLLPWSLGEVAIAGVFSMALYIGACVLHGTGLGRVSVLFNNLYFLVLNTVICGTAAYYKAHARFEEFRLRSELAQSYRQVSELERVKTEFFANVSHELRTPLTLILAPLEDLLRRSSELPDDVREALTLAQHNSLRLLKLINDLLEVIRMESGELSLHVEPIDAGQFVGRQCESVRQLAKLKGLELEVSVPIAPVFTMADPVHLEKILVNLLTNAIKFTPRGGRIAVQLSREGRMAVAQVKDTGVGIAASELPFIFNRFHQADGSATRRFSGMGIGLALAKELTEKLGGRLTVESTLGQGTTFWLGLVCCEPAADAPPPPDTGAADDSVVGLFREADRFVAVDDTTLALRAAAPRPTGTVLVIDDEPDMRRYLATILSDRYTVLSAPDGLEGLDIARRERPQIVLVDLMMPGLDGWEVCATLKKDGQAAPKVVVVTARTDEMAKIRALEVGADDFLGKPFSTLEVRTRLANLYRAHALEASVRRQNAELVDAMRKLRATEAQLVQREKMVAVSRMAGGILHEINNPLNFTLTAIGVALDRISQDAMLGEILKDIEAGMVRIRDIVSDLRDFANPGYDERRDHFDLNRVVDRALQLTQTQLKGIRIERDLAAGCRVYGSESQLLQVLMNLLLNAEAALRATQTVREPLIRIAAAAGDGRTRISVWDNGSGIPVGLIDKILDPFVTTRDVGQGMGLGLSICQTLVAAHGGTIAIRSQEGEYTEVAFELPNLKAEDAA